MNEKQTNMNKKTNKHEWKYKPIELLLDLEREGMESNDEETKSADLTFETEIVLLEYLPFSSFDDRSICLFYFRFMFV